MKHTKPPAWQVEMHGQPARDTTPAAVQMHVRASFGLSCCCHASMCQRVHAALRMRSREDPGLINQLPCNAPHDKSLRPQTSEWLSLGTIGLLDTRAPTVQRATVEIQINLIEIRVSLSLYSLFGTLGAMTKASSLSTRGLLRSPQGPSSAIINLVAMILSAQVALG